MPALNWTPLYGDEQRYFETLRLQLAVRREFLLLLKSGGVERVPAQRRTGIITRMTYAIGLSPAFDRGAAHSRARNS